MRKFFLPVFALTLAFSSPSRAAYKAAAGVEPALMEGQVPMDISETMGRAIAEILSWELSFLQSIRVEDPASVSKAMDSRERSGIGDAELEDARAVARRLNLDAVLLPHVVRKGGKVKVEVGYVLVGEGRDRRFVNQWDGPEGQVLSLLRGSVAAALDSVGTPLPPEVRRMWLNTSGDSWEALSAFSRGLAAEESGRTQEALLRYREALQREPNIPALARRLKTLQAEVDAGRR